MLLCKPQLVLKRAHWSQTLLFDWIKHWEYHLFNYLHQLELQLWIIMVQQYTFLLKVNETFKNLNLHALAKFQNELYACKFIIIHEMIMIRWILLRKFDLRLHIAFSSRQGEPFDRLFVCSLGDINWLLSVKDRPFLVTKLVVN